MDIAIACAREWDDGFLRPSGSIVRQGRELAKQARASGAPVASFCTCVFYYWDDRAVLDLCVRVFMFVCFSYFR